MKTQEQREEIARKARAIYAKIRDQYEPEHKGKYLAIEVESGMVHMERELNDAILWAQERFSPGREFFGIRIGYDYVETIYHLAPAYS